MPSRSKIPEYHTLAGKLTERLRLTQKFNLRQLIIINHLNSGEECMAGDLCESIVRVEKGPPPSPGAVFSMINRINAKSWRDRFLIIRSSSLGRGNKAIFRKVSLAPFKPFPKEPEGN